MHKLDFVDYKYNSVKYKALVPVKCPHCGTTVNPTYKSSGRIRYSLSHVIVVVTLFAKCCDKIYFVTNLEDNATREPQFISIYPSIMHTVLPDPIQNISPKFAELYKQAYTAEQNNHFEIAGTGYRNAIEILIKDYAVNELKVEYSSVCKKSLYDAIEEYIPTLNLKNSADVVRIIGNDLAHYERKFEDLDFNVLKQYVEIFIQHISVNIITANPPVRRDRLES